jgi:hypothetical protein
MEVILEKSLAGNDASCADERLAQLIAAFAVIVIENATHNITAIHNSFIFVAKE